MSCGTILTSTAWTALHSCVPRFYHPWQFVMEGPDFMCCILQNIRGTCFPCHITCVCRHLRHPVNTDLGIARLFNDCHYTVPLPVNGMEHNSSIFVWWPPYICLSTQPMLPGITAVHRFPLYSLSCCSCFGFFFILPMVEQGPHPQFLHHTLYTNIYEYKLTSHLQQPRT